MAISPPDDRYGEAALSPWTTRVVAFTRWVGLGHRVTQTGRLTLAQARELVSALDTGDVIDPVVQVGTPHHQRRRTPRAEHHLCVGQGGAAGAGHRRQAGRRTEERRAAGAASAVVGADVRHVRGARAGDCPPGWGESLLRGHFAEGIRAILSAVSDHDGPAGLDLVCRWGWDAVSHGGRIAGAPAAHRDTWRRSNDRDVRAAVGVLARFGALRLDGSPEAYVVALTALGRAALPSCWPDQARTP